MPSKKPASLNPQQQRFRQAERLRLRYQRNSITLGEQLAASIQLASQLCELPPYKRAQTIASYLPDDGEIFTDDIHKNAWPEKKIIALPIMQDDQQLQFTLYNDQDELSTGRWGIRQPKTFTLITEDEIDIVLVPLVGFDQKGNRLGRGGGFYDRFLCRCANAVFIGLAHDFQYIQDLPSAEWDIPLQFVITPSKTYYCS